MTDQEKIALARYHVLQTGCVQQSPKKNLEKFEDLKGCLLTSVQNTKDAILFTLSGGDQYKLYHNQDCCESVYVEDIIGDLNDLVGVPILIAEEACSHDHPEGYKKPEYEDESFTWTFYKFATIKGYVTIRFYGSSNGYYSESVDFVKV